MPSGWLTRFYYNEVSILASQIQNSIFYPNLLSYIFTYYIHMYKPAILLPNGLSSNCFQVDVAWLAADGLIVPATFLLTVQWICMYINSFIQKVAYRILRSYINCVRKFVCCGDDFAAVSLWLFSISLSGSFIVHCWHSVANSVWWIIFCCSVFLLKVFHSRAG